MDIKGTLALAIKVAGAHAPLAPSFTPPEPNPSMTVRHTNECAQLVLNCLNHLAPMSRSIEPACLDSGRNVADLIGLSQAVIDTISQARVY